MNHEGKTTTDLRTLQGAEWDVMEREVVERIHALKAITDGLKPGPMADKIAQELILPNIATLAHFITSVQLEGEPGAAAPGPAPAAPNQAAGLMGAWYELALSGQTSLNAKPSGVRIQGNIQRCEGPTDLYTLAQGIIKAHTPEAAQRLAVATGLRLTLVLPGSPEYAALKGKASHE